MVYHFRSIQFRISSFSPFLTKNRQFGLRFKIKCHAITKLFQIIPNSKFKNVSIFALENLANFKITKFFFQVETITTKPKFESFFEKKIVSLGPEVENHWKPFTKFSKIFTFWNFIVLTFTIVKLQKR